MTNFNIKNFVLDSISRYSLPIVIHSYADLEAEIQSNLEKKRQAKLELLRFDTGLPGIIIEKISHKDPLELTHNYIKIEDSGQKIDDLIHELVWTLTQKKITINCQNREENLKHCLKLTKDLIDSQESETILIQNSAITPKKRFDKSRAGKSQVSKNMNKIGIEILDESIRTLQQISDKSVDHNKISDIIETKNSLKSQFEALVIDPKTADLLQFLIDIEKSKQKALNTLQSSNEKHFITNQCKQNLQLLGILAQNNPGLITNLKEISEQNSNLTYDLLLKLNQEIALQISNFSAEIENKRKLDDLDRPKIDERNEGLDLTNIDKLSDLIETDKQLPIKPTNLDLDAFTYVEDCKNHIFIMYLSGELLSHFLPGDEHIIQKIKEKLTKIPVYSPQKLMSLSSKIDAVIVSFCAKIHQISSQEIFKKAEKIRNIFENHKQKLMIPKIAHMISNKLPGQKQEITFENIQIIEEEQCKAIPILFTLTKFFGNIEDQFKAWTYNEDSENVLKQPIENRAEIYLSLRYKQTIQELKLLNNLDLVFERILQIRNKISHYGDKESVKTDNMLEILTEIGEKIENLQKSNGEITKLVEINKNLNGKYDDLSAENVKLAATSIENAFNLQKLSENIETLHRENDSLVEKMRFLEINNIKIIDESSKLSGDHENLTKENEILKESALNSVKNTEIYKSDVNKLVKLHHDEIENLRTECSQLLGLTPIASILHDENELDIILSEDINLWRTLQNNLAVILSKSNQIETEFINKYIVKLETYREDASSINDPSRNLNEFIEKIETIFKLLSAKDKNKQKNGGFSLERKRESEDKNSGSDLKDSTLRNRESNKEHELGFTSDSLNISNLSFKDEKSLETENLMSIIKYLELENEALKETDITTYNKLIQKETEVTTVNQMLTHLYKEIDRLKIEIENNEKEIAEMQRKYKLEMDIIIADNGIWGLHQKSQDYKCKIQNSLMIEHVFSEDVINRKNKSLQIVNLPADISIKKIDIKSVHDHYDIRKIESDNLDLVNPENLVMTENIAEKIEEDIELIEEKSEISFGSTKDTNHLKKLHQKTSQKLRSNQPIIIIKPEESESTENVNLISEKKEESVLQNEKEEDLYVNLKEPEDSKNKQTAEKILEIDMEATGLAYMNPENKGSKEILTQEEIDSFNSKFDINIFKKDQNLIGLDSIQNTNRQETTEKNPIIFKKPKKYVKIDKLSPNKLKSFVTKTSQEFDELIASPIGTPPEINYDEAIEKFKIVEKSEEIIRNPNQKPRLIIKRYGNIQQSPRINEKLNKKLVDDGNFLTKDVQKTYKSQEIDHNYKKFNTELLVEDQTENPLDLDSSFIREDLTSLDSEGTNILTEESFKISEENHPETKLNQKFIVKRPTKPTISDIGIFKNSQDSFTSDPNYKSDSNFLTSQLNTDFDPSYTPLFSLKRLPTIKISAEAEAQTRENIQQEKTKLLRENLILDQFSKVEVRSERPMSYVNLFRFFEDMMDNKHKTDLKDLQDRRRPRSMTEFLMEYLNRRFGIESLAMKTLGQLLPALKSLANEGHPYARLFARLLQIFHPDPVPYNLSLYLVKARIEFHHYIEKAEKIKEALSLKPNKESSNKTHGKAAYEHAGTGGEAMIVDIIDHIYMLFEEDPESGTLMIEKICPDKVDFNDFVAFLIANKMRKKGKKPEDIFLQLDKDHGGSLDAVEFIQGAKGDLEVWISDLNIIKFFYEISKSSNGELKFSEFSQVINFENYIKSTKNLDFVVTKERFLSSIVDVYNFRQIRDGAFLTQSLSENHFELFDQFTFKETIHMIDPWIHDGKIADLYTEALAVSQTPGLADKDAFVKIALRHGIGKYGLGSFVIRELLDVLTERQFVVDISLQPGENISFKKIEDLDSKKTPSRGSTAEETKDHYTPKFLRKRGPQS